MRKAPGRGPGPSALAAGGYDRPALAGTVALAGFAVAALLVIALPEISRIWMTAPDAVGALLDLVVGSGPFVVFALLGAALAGPAIARGLGLAWRWSDIGLGASVGLVVRAVIELIAPTTGALGSPFGSSAAALVVIALGAALFTPIAEELFFRGLVLRAVSGLTARAGRWACGVAAVLVSTAAFVGMHTIAAGGALPLGTLLASTGVGLAAGILTVVTGRLGAALAVHIVSNTIGVVVLAV